MVFYSREHPLTCLYIAYSTVYHLLAIELCVA